jgi:hypothetical protein
MKRMSIDGNVRGSWPAVLQQATVEDAAIIYFTKSYFEHKIRDFNPLALLFVK